MTIARQPAARPTQARSGRNEACRCGSGRKFKRCCGAAPAVAAKTAADLSSAAGAAPPVSLALGKTPAGRGRYAGGPDRPHLFTAGRRPQRAPPASTAAAVFACLQRGAQLFEDGHPAAAIAPLSEVVSLAPENAVAHYDLGLARLESHRLPEAVASFQQAIALKPDFAGAYYNLAIAPQRADWLPNMSSCAAVLSFTTSAVIKGSCGAGAVRG